MRSSSSPCRHRAWGAAVDSLLHHAHVAITEGIESHRLAPAIAGKEVTPLTRRFAGWPPEPMAATGETMADDPSRLISPTRVRTPSVGPSPAFSSSRVRAGVVEDAALPPWTITGA